jgi:hypothetical protein
VERDFVKNSLSGGAILPSENRKMADLQPVQALNDLGAEGWELVTVTTENAVFSEKTQQGNTDGASWKSMLFFLKRPASE